MRPRRRPQDRLPPSGAQGRDLPPVLSRGGDMVGLAIREDTPAGEEVYRLRADDPEGRPVSAATVL